MVITLKKGGRGYSKKKKIYSKKKERKHVPLRCIYVSMAASAGHSLVAPSTNAAWWTEGNGMQRGLVNATTAPLPSDG